MTRHRATLLAPAIAPLTALVLAVGVSLGSPATASAASAASIAPAAQPTVLAAATHPVSPHATTVRLRRAAGAAHGSAAPAQPATAATLTTPELRVPSRVAVVGVSWPRGQLTPPPPHAYPPQSPGVWSTWQRVATERDGPDPGSAEARTGRDARDGTDAITLIDVDAVQARVAAGGSSSRTSAAGAAGTAAADPAVDLAIVDPGATAGAGVEKAPAAASAPVTAQAAAQPAIYSRAQWGADETLRDKKDLTYGEVQVAIVHHTASSNNYLPADVPAILRGIYAYHTNPTWGRGWSDIGYNFLVDKYGRIWEGRYGGITQAVSGAHAYSNNGWSTGISVLGTYDYVTPPPVVIDAVSRLIAWKFTIHGIPVAGPANLDPRGTYLRVIGHRDAFDNATGCPGNALETLLPTIRTKAAAYQGALTGTTTVTRPADGTFTVSGRGSGAGTGLGQWGAYAMARAGKSASTILSYYYPGTTRLAKTATVRVALQRVGTGPQIYATSGTLRYAVNGSATFLAPPAGAVQIRVIPVTATSVTLQSRTSATAAWATFSAYQRTPITLRDSGGAVRTIVGAATRPFRGDTMVYALSPTALRVVNRAGLEDVTRGSLSVVIPATWPAAALQAQAVATRTYVLRQVQQTEGKTLDDTCDNCVGYLGVSGETAATSAAVGATGAVVVYADGFAANTSYTRSNGALRAQGGYTPYLLPFADTWDTTAAPTSRVSTWTAILPAATIERAYPAIGSLRSVTIQGRTGGGTWGGRATSIQLTGSAGVRVVPAERFRLSVGLTSAWFQIAP